MKLKKQILLGILIGGMALISNVSDVRAIEYEEKWTSTWERDIQTQFTDLIKVSDKGSLAVGLSFDNNGVVVKYDTKGNNAWIDVFSEGKENGFTSATELSDGSYVVVGGVRKDGSQPDHGVLVKYRSDGTREWVKEEDKGEGSYFSSVVATSDGGFAVVGRCTFNNNSHAILIKYNSEGDEEWVKVLDGNKNECFLDIIALSDSGYVVTGYSDSTDLGFNSNGFAFGILVKFNSEGDQEWLTFCDEENSMFEKVIKTDDGGFVAIGFLAADNGSEQGLIVKYNKEGAKEWAILDEEINIFFDAVKMNDGTILTSGYSMMNMSSTLLVIDEQGEVKKILSNPTMAIVTLVSDIDGGFLGGGASLLDGKAILIKYSPKTDADIQINGTIQPMMADITIPSVSPDLVIDPNLPDGAMSPEFEIQNDSTSPIKLELKTFEQTTNSFNDVLPDKYDSWEGLNKNQSKDIALGLVAKEGDGWQRLTTPTSYVAGHTEHEIGVIKPTSQVNFEFEVHHGRAFSESKTVQYKLVFVFDLLS